MASATRKADGTHVLRVGPGAVRALLERREHPARVLLAAREGEREQRVQVVEDVEAALRPSAPSNPRAPASASRRAAAQRDAPQQLRGVDELERDHGLLRVHQPVVHVERGRDVAELELVQREVPPVVERERGVGDQFGAVAFSHSMPSWMRPCISNTCCTACTAQGSRGFERERVAADVLGAGVVAGLLEAEGVHAEQVAVAGHLVVPVRQGLRDAVAQHHRVAEVEVDDVRRLQRERSRG